MILHISTAHNPLDIRIYRKEVCSLLDNGFKVRYLVPCNDKTILNEDHITIKKSHSRIKRMIVDNWLLFKKIKKLKPKIIHFHDPEFLIYGYILKKYYKMHVIYDAHEDLPRAILSKHYIHKYIRKLVSFIAENIENYISKRLSFIITATPFIEQRFKKLNKNTICINNYPLLNELNNPENMSKERIVCYVGGLSEVRGSKVLTKVSNLLDDIEIHVAGNVRDIDKKNNLKLLGNLERNQVGKLMSKSIAGLVTFLPEPNHINARPNKMFEYMSAGLPVICSNFTEWKELVDEYNVGITVNPVHENEIVSAINYLANNQEIASKMGENGRKAIENVFNWESESLKLINIYENLCKEDL
ncbi:glycosyltransferase [Abyssicoccus albus]|uniref:Glycosyltransferase involved in cell wall biosynthesis n=1 Tax=Abyssicoccus albus TaxID=1817405 RepID=A0A3N5CDN1_9BACL|nr:glycosyltransferase [Abyssicoccus albus]RPF58292.1 glycosyltransferase involved in cell wall biosynthesis [Abyssicoccus albus]